MYSKVLFNEEFQGSDPRVSDSALLAGSSAESPGRLQSFLLVLLVI
jgi:hypothetical protein